MSLQGLRTVVASLNTQLHLPNSNGLRFIGAFHSPRSFGGCRHTLRRDWGGVRELTSADATGADRCAAKFGEVPYFFNYERWPWPWKLAVGDLDGEPVVIILRRGADTWTAYSAIRMNVIDHKI